MIIDCNAYAGVCACGKTHRIDTRRVLIEAGCLQAFANVADELGLLRPIAAVYDENTYRAVSLSRPKVDQEIVLPTGGLQASERCVADALGRLQAQTRTLVAVGAGTVHDIARLCAQKLGAAFVSCPTAASCDGYASPFSVLVENGVRAMRSAAAPVLVLADVDVLKSAPGRLTKSGVGMALSNHIALCDWKIAHLLAGEPDCPTAEALLRQSAVAAQGCAGGVSRGEGGAIAQLMYALLLPGLVLQMMQSARPALSAARHLSWLLRLQARPLGIAPDMPEGELMGASAVLAADLYHNIAEIDEIAPLLRPLCASAPGWFVQYFAGASDLLARENTPDCLEQVDERAVARQWDAIRRAVEELPPRQALCEALQSAGAPAGMEDLGVPGARIPRLSDLAPYMGNRPTLLRLTRHLSAAASRAPSRSSRYAESAITRAGKSSAVSASSIR